MKARGVLIGFFSSWHEGTILPKYVEQNLDVQMITQKVLCLFLFILQIKTKEQPNETEIMSWLPHKPLNKPIVLGEAGKITKPAGQWHLRTRKH